MTTYGHFVIRCENDPSYEHRIACHVPPDTSNFSRFEDGVYRKVNFDRGFYAEWEPAT